MAIYNIDSLPSKFQPGDIIQCPYSGTIKSITLPIGTWMLQCWGGGNGAGYHSHGYSTGYLRLNTPTTLYCVVGEKAGNNNGGYNGGGSRGDGKSGHGGAGATHIALRSGILSSLESYKDQVIIVAGGASGYATSNDSTTGGGNLGGGGAFGKGNNGWEYEWETTDSEGQTKKHTAYGYPCGGGWYGGSNGNRGSSNNYGSGGSGYINPILSNGYTAGYYRSTNDSYNGYIQIVYITDGSIYNISNTPSKLAYHDIITCPYSGTIKSISLPTGTYKLDCWGGNGGDVITDTASGEHQLYDGGNGGHSSGILTLSMPTTLYLCAGQKGHNSSKTETSYYNSYNGGGHGGKITVGLVDAFQAGGGGATHIALRSGLLSDLGSYKSDIIMVAGGAGGAYTRAGLMVNYALRHGSRGGGNPGEKASGSDDAAVPNNNTSTAGTGAGFGYGASVDSNRRGGAGGAGYYGGGAGKENDGAGTGGTGYVNNGLSILSNAVTEFSINETNTTNPDPTHNGYITITVVDLPKSMESYVNINNSWKIIDSIFTNVNGIWKSLDKLSAKDPSDVWREPSSSYATADITWPSGASVSISCDGTTLQLGTSGHSVVSIPFPGMWISTTSYSGWSNTEYLFINRQGEIHTFTCHIPIAVPVPNTPTYNGSVQNLTWASIDSNAIAISGTTSGTNAGSYTAVATFKYSQLCWPDGSTGPKNITWRINKATAQVSVDPTSHEWEENGTYDFTVSNPSGGALSASSSDTNYFTVPATFSGSTLTVTAQNQKSSKQTGTITITSAATANYNASSCTIACTLKSSVCVTGDTLIMLADYTQKRIDQITYSDMLLTYNMDTGSFESAEISKIYYHGDAVMGDNFRLTFNNGYFVDVINKHGFLNTTKHEYSQIDLDNFEDYIGDSFMLFDGTTAVLESVSVMNESAEAWSLITKHNENFITNGVISMTGNRGSVFAIGADMKYDQAQKESDINTYGVFNYDEFVDRISREDFYELNCQYYKIPLAKGYIDYNYIYNQIPMLTEYNVVPKK